jgi:hypothetical protein
MKSLKYLVPLSLTLCFMTQVVCFAADDDNEGYGSIEQEQRRDFEALMNYVKTKRAISVAEKGGNLMISGNVRSEYYNIHTKTAGKHQRGVSTRKLYPNNLLPPYSPSKSRKGTPQTHYAEVDLQTKRKAPYPTNEFDIEANLICDYVAERGWGTIQLQFSNTAGIKEIDRKPEISSSRRMLYGSGEVDNIALRKAYMGYNIWEQGTSRFDFEIGRRRLYDAFDSRIQFGSYYDGALLRMTSSVEGIADIVMKLSAFVIDDTVNHAGYVGEVGFLDILDTGLDLKYSLIDWNKTWKNRWGYEDPTGVRFCNSQFTMAYNLPPDLWFLKTQFYGAYLINTKAKGIPWTHGIKDNRGYYLGVRTGEVVRKGDYAFDLSYQAVGAQAVPERDISGYGRDNPRGVSFYNRRWGGFANYKGCKLEGFYAVTDNWTIDAYLLRIRQKTKAIGGHHRSFEAYVAAIFAF